MDKSFAHGDLLSTAETAPAVLSSGRRHGLPDRHLYQWPRRPPWLLGVFAFRLSELVSNTMITYMFAIGIAGERFALAVLSR